MPWREKSENQLEQCRFSAAVGADHGGKHAVADVEADVMENFSGVVGEAEMMDGYDGGSVHGKQWLKKYRLERCRIGENNNKIWLENCLSQARRCILYF